LGTGNRITIKVIAVALCLCIIAATMLIASNTINGYELSIYSSLIPATFILLLTPISGGIGIILYSLYKKDNYWKIGLVLVVISNLIIVLLPYLQGYVFSDGGDHLTHLGFIKDILNTGQFDITNFYPVIHVFGAQLSMVSNVSAEAIINFLGPLFYLLFIVFTYILSRELLSRPLAVLAANASTILFGYYYHEVFPMGFAFMLIPLILFLYFRNLRQPTFAIRFILILMLILLVFLHLIASFIVTALLLIIEIVNFVLNRFSLEKKEPAKITVGQIKFNSSYILISLFCFVLWIWYRFYIWNETVYNVALWFNTELFTMSMTSIAQISLNKLGLNLLGQLFLFIKIYGHTFLFLLLSVFAIGHIFRNRFILKREDSRRLIAYSCIFVVLVAIWLVDLRRPLTTLESGRLISSIFAVFPILVGIALDKIGEFSKYYNEYDVLKPLQITDLKPFIRGTFIWVLITGSSLIGIISVYPSPIIYQPNQGISHASFNSEAWLVQKGAPQLNVFLLYSPPTLRIANAIWGTNATEYPKSNEKSIEDHFGYNQHQAVGEKISGNMYMFITSETRLLYTRLWPQVGRFTEEDYLKLKDDNTVNLIYNNCEAQNYYITGK
jgi:hypothetical protein